jgi:very-short-patch-repair endonuclease
MAAVLACGEGAVLSHRSAAALWELLRPMEGPVDVSVPSNGGKRRRGGIRLHRCPSLASTEPIGNAYLTDGGVPDGLALVTLRHGIPVTTPARTIADLRRSVPPRLYRRAVRQAELAGYALDANVEADRTRSDLERDFLRLVRRAGLPMPEVNVKVDRWTVDFLWPAHRLVAETDSYLYHHGTIAFEDDRRRDLDLRRRGFAVHRFTERQLSGEPEQVAADLRDALAL